MKINGIFMNIYICRVKHISTIPFVNNCKVNTGVRVNQYNISYCT